MSPIKRGALIVIEGVDRSGKSTQCKNLVRSLENKKISSKLLNFPDRTTSTGKLIDEYLKNENFNLNDEAIHLLFSANRWENVEKMKTLLFDGVTLVIDRYSYSGIVFSAVKKNMNLDWCKQPENGLPKPDLVFLLTLDEEEMQCRPGFGSERYENIEFQKHVSKMYEQLCDEHDNWEKIDASGSIDEIQQKLLNKCVKKILEVRNTPLGVLNFSKTSH